MESQPVSRNRHSAPQAAMATLLARASETVDILAIIDEAARQLRDTDGVPVDRISWATRAMHPEIAGFQGLWLVEDGVREVKHAISGQTNGYNRAFERSPLAPLYHGEAQAIRRSLRVESDLDEFDILRELHERGYTDYLALIVPCPSPFERIPVTFVTRAREGFCDDHIAQLSALLPLLTIVLRGAALRRGTRTLLETYLGRDSASRVLDGHIRRGEMVQMQAAVCFCDLRNFTHYSQTLEPAALLELLHDVFDAVVSSVHEGDGDILKFIGDAVLAVFRVDVGDPEGPRRACERAMRAAQTALARIAERNRTRKKVNLPQIDVGLAIHLGNVHYGNIGAPGRLDFTVIGATVNLASRLEGMCRALGYPIVVSEGVAQQLPAYACEDAGLYTLKGVTEPVRIFGTRLLH